MKKKYYPIGLDIRRKKCVVVGSGNVAQRKIKRLQKYGAKILVINPYEKRCLKGAYLVFACTDNLSLNKRIANDAIEAGVLVNVANPGRASSFILPAIAEKNGFTISVSTDGKYPKMAKRLCEEIEKA